MKGENDYHQNEIIEYNMDYIIEKSKTMVLEAGKLIIKMYSEEYSISEKGIGDFVTEIDKAVESYLIEQINSILPNSNVISEESYGDIKSCEDPLWIIDPVDGTNNLIHKYPYASINVGFSSKNLKFGIVYNPFSNELFIAKSGDGAYLNEKKIMVSKVADIRDSLIGFGFPYDRKKADLIFDIGKQIYSNCSDLKRRGSASLDILDVACGRMDGYFELDLKIWDYFAASVILKESGGIISDWNGIEKLELKKNNILVSNSILHTKLISLLKMK